MDWTDVHYRQLARLLSRHTWLWTEMVVDKTVLHVANIDKYLWSPPEQRPIVCQLGGSDPQALARAAAVVAKCAAGARCCVDPARLHLLRIGMHTLRPAADQTCCSCQMP